MKSIRILALVNLTLLAWVFAGAVLFAWTHGSPLAQSVLSSLQINGTNPNPLGTSSNTWTVGVTCTSDASNTSFGQPASNCLQNFFTWNSGDYSFGNGSNNKSSPSVISNTMNKFGGAQAVLNNNAMNCFGVGDCGLQSNQMLCGAYSINGDETSCGLSVVNNVQQEQDIQNLQQSITSVTKTTCNTTTTQSLSDVSAPATITFTVASTTGCNPGDWIVLGQEVPAESPNLSAVKITSVGVGTLTAAVRENYPNGTTVTPGVVLNLPSGQGIGQGRYLINHSQTYYTNGTAAATINTGTVTGSSTVWTNGIVGGNATNIGCIAFDGDDYDGQGQNGGANLSGATITGTALAFSSKANNAAGPAIGQRLVGAGVTAGTVVSGGSSATVTITIASPAVVTWTGSNFSANQPVSFTTTGALPTGITAGTQYYVIAAGLGANSFEISTTIGGGAVNTTGIQSGTQTGNSWTVTPSQTESTPETMFLSVPKAQGSWSISGTTLSASTSGLAVGEVVYGAGVIDGTMIVGGSSGAWTLNVNNGTISAEQMAASYTMRSWYQINTVAGNTNIGITTTAPGGAPGYAGLQTTQGKYLIRPCARILYIIDTHDVVLESTATTWSANDFIEEPVVPYLDMAGYLFRVLDWEPGAVTNPFISIVNAGARTWSTGINIGIGNNVVAGSNADTVPFGTDITIGWAHTGLQISQVDTQAILLNSAFAGDLNGDTSGKIAWNASGIYMAPNSTHCGMDHQLTMAGAGGLLSSISYVTSNPPCPTSVLSTGTSSGLQWQGVFGTTPVSMSALPTCGASVEGYERAVNDGSTAVFNGTLTGGAGVAGGGSNHVKAYCNGTNWTAH